MFCLKILAHLPTPLQNLGYQIEYLDSGVDKIPDRCNADWLIVPRWSDWSQ